jgi:hypothetical protein
MSTSGTPRRERRGGRDCTTHGRPTSSGDGGGDRLRQHPKMIISDSTCLRHTSTKTTSNLVALKAFADRGALGVVLQRRPPTDSCLCLT